MNSVELCLVIANVDLSLFWRHHLAPGQLRPEGLSCRSLASFGHLRLALRREYVASCSANLAHRLVAAARPETSCTKSAPWTAGKVGRLDLTREMHGGWSRQSLDCKVAGEFLKVWESLARRKVALEVG